MQKCIECGSNLIEIDFSKSKTDYKHTADKHGRAFKCKKCNLIYLDEKTSEKIEKELKKAIKDKQIKVDGEVWEEVSKFVKGHKKAYPSIKFFTQRALLEKMSREN